MNTISNTTFPHSPAEKSAPYVLVWAALMLLTGLTVAIASLRLAAFAIIVCLGIAALKSLLVIFFFMHLRREKRLIIKLVIPIAFAALTIFIGLTYLDVITR